MSTCDARTPTFRGRRVASVQHGVLLGIRESVSMNRSRSEANHSGMNTTSGALCTNDGRSTAPIVANTHPK